MIGFTPDKLASLQFWHDFESNKEAKALSHVKNILFGFKKNSILDILESGKSEAVALLFHAKTLGQLPEGKQDSVSSLIMLHFLQREDWDNYKRFFSQFTHLNKLSPEASQKLFNYQVRQHFKQNPYFPLKSMLSQQDLPLNYITDRNDAAEIQAWGRPLKEATFLQKEIKEAPPGINHSGSTDLTLEEQSLNLSKPSDKSFKI